MDKITVRYAVFAAVAGLAMGLLALLFLGSPSPVENYEKMSYNNFEFIKKDGFWFTEARCGGELHNFSFRYAPQELASVPVHGQLNNEMFAAPLYLTTDSRPPRLDNPEEVRTEMSTPLMHEPLVYMRVSRLMRTCREVRLLDACTANDSYNFFTLCPITRHNDTKPVVSCAREGDHVIYINRTGEADVRFNGQCLVIGGYDEKLYRAFERFQYQFLGIMK